MPIDAKASEILSRGWYGERLEPNQCEYLLTFRDKSSEANLAVSLANRLVHKASANVGQITAEIEVSTGPCSRNCKFCKYAEGHTDSCFKDLDDDSLIRMVGQIGLYSDVKNIRLMTCGDADIDVLSEYVKTAKSHARKGTRIYVNTRDLDPDECRQLKNAGAYGAYHACRLREGKDTEIHPDKRLDTIRNLSSAGLSVVTGVEPIGPEHSIKEIVESFYTTLNMKCASNEIIAREPVTGTEFDQYSKLSPSRMAQIRAVLTLASSWYVPPVRTAFPGTYVTGQNNVLVKFTQSSGKEQLEAARRKLFNNNFDRLLKVDDSTVELNLMYLKQTGSV